MWLKIMPHNPSPKGLPTYNNFRQARNNNQGLFETNTPRKIPPSYDAQPALTQ